MIVAFPKRLAEELERRGADAESLVIDSLVKSLGLDPLALAWKPTSSSLLGISRRARGSSTRILSKPLRSSIKRSRRPSRPSRCTLTSRRSST